MATIASFAFLNMLAIIAVVSIWRSDLRIAAYILTTASITVLSVAFGLWVGVIGYAPIAGPAGIVLAFGLVNLVPVFFAHYAAAAQHASNVAEVRRLLREHRS